MQTPTDLNLFLYIGLNHSLSGWIGFMNYSLDNTSELIIDLKRGNKKAYDFIFATLFIKLVHYIMGLTGDRHKAEDIVQHVFMKLWENRSSLDINTSIKNYLYRSSHNRFIDLYRQEQKQFRLSDMIYYKTQMEEEEVDDGQISLEKQKLRAAIEKLPPKRKEIFKLNKFRGLEYTEIATQLNISVKTVENHMGKALKLIRDEVKKN